MKNLSKCLKAYQDCLDVELSYGPYRDREHVVLSCYNIVMLYLQLRKKEIGFERPARSFGELFTDAKEEDVWFTRNAAKLEAFKDYVSGREPIYDKAVVESINIVRLVSMRVLHSLSQAVLNEYASAYIGSKLNLDARFIDFAPAYYIPPTLLKHADSEAAQLNKDLWRKYCLIRAVYYLSLLDTWSTVSYDIYYTSGYNALLWLLTFKKSESSPVCKSMGELCKGEVPDAGLKYSLEHVSCEVSRDNFKYIRSALQKLLELLNASSEESLLSRIVEMPFGVTLNAENMLSGKTGIIEFDEGGDPSHESSTFCI